MNSKRILLTGVILVCSFTARTQNIYDEDDKEGLRMFLRQPSAIDGKINAEMLGLQISDTLDWETSETWVEKVEGLTWSWDPLIIPKRLFAIGTDVLTDTFRYYPWKKKNLAGILDVRAFTYLHSLICVRNQISAFEVGASNTALRWLELDNNQLDTLDISNSVNWDMLDCFNNHLQLSNLFDISEKVRDVFRKGLGKQRLHPQETKVGKVIDFSSQARFKNINTVFKVEKNSIPAVLNMDYTINNGLIIFKTAGNYTVTMTNAAIISNIILPDCDSAQVIAEFSVIDTADATLRSLLLFDLPLSSFNKDTLCYTINVNCDVEQVLISASPNDPQATVSGDLQMQPLAKGKNTFIITVTARDGITTLNYTVIVNRNCDNIAPITNYELQITGYEIYNVVGQKLYTFPNENGKASSPLERAGGEVLPAGIYILKIYTNKGILTKKIIHNL